MRAMVSLVALCTALGAVHAQTQSSALYQQTAIVSEIATKTKTAPEDDAVLDEPPIEIGFEFPERVRLVKLTLRNADRDWIDIDFRYSPAVEDHFVWPLPVLAATSYYTADWAALAANDQLVRGSFSFAFGPDAKPPSIEREADEILMQLRYGDPNVRSVPPPPTQIIINQNPPDYDPPFTINLNESVSPGPG